MSLNIGLVSYWKLDGNSTDSIDSNTGTDTAISYSAGNGLIIQGAGFNGSTSKILIPSQTVTNCTISFWVNFTVTGSNSSLVTFSSAQTFSLGFSNNRGGAGF